MSALFPLRIACGDRFCNRIEERKLLKSYILEQQPVVLISPRRYGKTSLSIKVIKEIEYPFCSIDLLTAYDDESICKCIVSGISELISQIMPINLKTLEIIEKCFHGMKAAMHAKFIEIGFVSSSIDNSDPPKQVYDVLNGLEKI